MEENSNCSVRANSITAPIEHSIKQYHRGPYYSPLIIKKRRTKHTSIERPTGHKNTSLQAIKYPVMPKLSLKLNYARSLSLMRSIIIKALLKAKGGLNNAPEGVSGEGGGLAYTGS